MQVSRGKGGAEKEKTTWSALSWKTPDRTHKEQNKRKSLFKRLFFFVNSNNLL
jgi:hypothetical protein